MSIEYELSLNKLTTPPSYAPRVRPRATTGLAALGQRIAGSSTVAPADVQAVLVGLTEQIEADLIAGNWVALDGIGIITSSLKGRLASPTDPLPAGSEVEIGFRAEPRLRKNIRANAIYTRIDPSDQAPLLLTLTLKVGGDPGHISASNVLEILGDRLKIDLASADEGAYLVPASGPALRITNYLHNGDKQLLFALPDGITDGTDYTLQVRNRRKGSITLRTASWPAPLIGQV